MSEFLTQWVQRYPKSYQHRKTVFSGVTRQRPFTKRD